MRVLIEADGLMEARAQNAVNGLDLGSQARVTGRVLKGLMSRLSPAWQLIIASGKHLKFDAEEQTLQGGFNIKRAWIPRPDLLRWGNSISVMPMRRALERFLYPATFRAQHADVIHYTQRLPIGQRPLALREIWTALDLFSFYEPTRAVQKQINHLRNRLKEVEVMAISETTAADVHAILGVPKSRITVNYLAADDSLYGVEPSHDEAEQKKALNLPPSFFFYSGALYGRKNVITLLRALELFNENRETPIALLVAGGKGWPTPAEFANYSEIAQRLHAKGWYRHLGFLSDGQMALLHRSCLAYVHPATFEGFGMTILEAMSCGAPVVCGHNSAISEVAGSAAEYIEDPLDPESIASVLGKVAALSREELPELSRRSLAQAGLFSWSSFQSGVANLTFKELSLVEPSRP